MRNVIEVWDTTIGNVALNATQAAVIGTSMGNGAASCQSNPANTLQMGEGGNINVQIFPTGQNPGSINTVNVLAVFSLPAGAFDAANRGIQIQAIGTFANNVNSKTVNVVFNATTAVVGSAVSGGTVIATTGAFTTAAAVAWEISASVFKYGAAGSNTQLAIHNSSQIGATVTALTAPTLLTATESGNILIAITGDAVTTATDIALYYLVIAGCN
jgi:hypothetical protein